MPAGTRIRNRKKLYERVADWLEVPVSVTAPIPVFIIRGKREIEVEGCTGILEYGEERIVLAVGKNDRFSVRGKNLTLSDFRRRILYVRGEIASAVWGEEDASC